jgi:hypothetical protein
MVQQVMAGTYVPPEVTDPWYAKILLKYLKKHPMSQIYLQYGPWINIDLAGNRNIKTSSADVWSLNDSPLLVG